MQKLRAKMPRSDQICTIWIIKHILSHFVLNPAIRVLWFFYNNNANSKHRIQTQSHKGKFNYPNVSQHEQLSVRRLLCTHESAFGSFDYRVCSVMYVSLKEKSFFFFFLFSSFWAWVLRIIGFLLPCFLCSLREFVLSVPGHGKEPPLSLLYTSSGYTEAKMAKFTAWGKKINIDAI